MNTRNTSGTMSAIYRVIICAIFGIAGGITVGILMSWKYAPITTWDIAAVIFLIWTWITLHGSDAERTERLALREAPRHTVTDIVLVLASLASLVAVGIIIVEASQSEGVKAVILAALGVSSVAISWSMVQVIHTLRYAREFYKDKGCIDFNSKDLPRYSDFAYLAFTIGMTFQVSDTEIMSNKVRRTILHHSLISYLFSVVIVGVTINLLASLAS
jgi:uncharacterized membrane protein